MGNRWRGVTAAALVAACALEGQAALTSPTRAATTQSPQALAYVANGQVTVFEAGTLTTVGPGQSPAWSPNSANLLYMVPDFVAGAADIYVADTHGANAHRVISGAYPYISPSWSPDSKYVVYATLAAGAHAGGATTRLEVRALNVAAKAARVLGQFTLTGGCSTTGTALQAATSTAQGAYRGTPSTLIWAQPNLVVVQASCTGAGLTMFKIGGKPSTLTGWSAGTLSPDGRTIAAAALPAGAKPAAAQVGLITVSTEKTKILTPKLGAQALTWASDGKALFVVSQPTNTVTGSAQVTKLTPDGKTVTKLSSIQAAGIYHPSLDRRNTSLALAVVASTPTNAAAPPAISINFISAATPGPAHQFFLGGQPAWRP